MVDTTHQHHGDELSALHGSHTCSLQVSMTQDIEYNEMYLLLLCIRTNVVMCVHATRHVSKNDFVELVLCFCLHLGDRNRVSLAGSCYSTWPPFISLPLSGLTLPRGGGFESWYCSCDDHANIVKIMTFPSCPLWREWHYSKSTSGPDASQTSPTRAPELTQVKWWLWYRKYWQCAQEDIYEMSVSLDASP